MLSIDITCGLGNQLFQLMTLIAYSIKYNNPFIIERKTSSPGCTFRNVYWNNFLNKLEKYLVNSPVNFQIYNEKSFEYNELPEISNNINLKLSGKFQSYKYFDSYKKDILNMIDYETKKLEVRSNIININPDEMVSIHFRFGDIIDIHKNNSNILPLEYYINSINYIQKNEENKAIKFLYFCEESDKIFVYNNYINHLKNIFPNCDFILCDVKLEDWKQLILMSLCKHHIIANSTFSWWSAYLADNDKYKLICYPDNWSHSNIINDDTIDLFPNNWIKCETQNKNYLLENVYYINLRNCKLRKKETEDELIRMNWKFQRFEGIKHDDGRIGCCISHLKVIEMAKKNNLEYIVVVEDDIQFLQPDNYNQLLIYFNNFIKLNNLDYDVLLLAGSMLDRANGIKPINNIIYKAIACLTTTGYIVKKHYYDKLIDNYKEAIQLLINHGEDDRGCIDVNWQKLQSIDNWYILIPRTINQRPSHSIIQNRFVNYSSMLLD